jgi:putative membrane protein
MFTLITGLILIAASVPAGITTVSTVYTSGNVEIAQLLTNEVVVGQFVSGMIPFLWIGLGTMFAGILFSNWLNRKINHVTDTLRIIVLISLYPTVHQFTNILVNDASSFSLILPLVIGFGITSASATLLIRRYRKKKYEKQSKSD